VPRVELGDRLNKKLKRRQGTWLSRSNLQSLQVVHLMPSMQAPESLIFKQMQQVSGVFKTASNKSGILTPSGACNRTWTLWQNCSSAELLLRIAEVTIYPHSLAYLSSIGLQHQNSKRSLPAVGVSTAFNFPVAKPYSPVHDNAQECLK